ncbi:MAG: hypothetical protein AB7I18_05020 [Candidatus Berkiella sp.]
MKRGIKQSNQAKSIVDTFFNFGRNAAYFISNPFRYLAPSESRELADPRLVNNEEGNMESIWVRIIGQFTSLQDFRNLQFSCKQFYNLVSHSSSSTIIFSNLARNRGMPSDFGNRAHDIKTRLIQFNDKYPTELVEAFGGLDEILKLPIFEMGSTNQFQYICDGKYLIHPNELKGHKVVRGFNKGEPFMCFCVRDDDGNIEARTYFKKENQNWFGRSIISYVFVPTLGTTPFTVNFNELRTLLEGGVVDGFRLTDQRPAIANNP